jgi:hypothetical protein
MAWKSLRLPDQYRKLTSRQLPNSMYDADGREADEPSGTSKRLTNSDFETFMAIVERHAGDQVKTATKTYPVHHWLHKADDRLQRMRHYAQQLADALADAGLLDAAGVGLAGWISRRVTDGRTDRLADLEYHELHALINGLRAYARRNGVAVKAAA